MKKEEKEATNDALMSKGYKDYLYQKGWKSLEDVVDAYKKLEASSVPLPLEDDESWKEFYHKLGCPEKAEDYEFSSKKLPDDFPYSEELDATARQWAHKIGLSTEQGKKLHSMYLDYVYSKYKEACNHEENSMEQAKQLLRMRWGQNYRRNVELGRSAMQYLGGEKLPTILEAHGLGNHPEVLEAFVKLGQMLQEDSAIPGVDIINLTPDQALEERRKLQEDPEFFRAYLDSSDPEHENAIKKMQAVNKVIVNH